MSADISIRRATAEDAEAIAALAAQVRQPAPPWARHFLPNRRIAKDRKSAPCDVRRGPGRASLGMKGG
ncbi:hypothetical protein [Nannocystis radixulma]|uniref:Uncharacterized protein n=1 Tax=Nannocystis radixulma TaxID=2995305 RepID=A0ABT5B2B1_9BACT|nr:hypothetical protein [Nannocystis radixulma]MDC0668248.1 hypothetical protein [Nannocystis radixulma]